MQDPDTATGGPTKQPNPNRGLPPTDLREHAGTGKTLTVITDPEEIVDLDKVAPPELVEKIDRFLTDPSAGVRRTRPGQPRQWAQDTTHTERPDPDTMVGLTDGLVDEYKQVAGPAADTAATQEAADLEHWWIGNAALEAPDIARKAREYGSNSLAAMGRLIGRVQHRQPMTPAAELEYGCAVYAFGKMERVMDALVRGELPSEDTWRDIHVYSVMALRIRETGTWP
jgi:hypothetical protein